MTRADCHATGTRLGWLAAADERPAVIEPGRGRVSYAELDRLANRVAARLHQRANARRWNLSVAEFGAALERSASKIGLAEAADAESSLGALHLEDLALAAACECGDETAWEHFIREQRPVLYRAAAAIAGAEGRELADSLYAELFGLRERDGERQSLFRYFHGRSSLATWLRAVLAQRYVDRIRSRQRLDPLPEDDGPDAPMAPVPVADQEALQQAERVRVCLAAAIARLAPRDRLRLAWYYQQDMTLARIGRLCQEHEATVSRNLSRTRKALRVDVETQLHHAGLGPREIDECFAAVTADPGDADLRDLLDPAEQRKNTVAVRSKIEERS
jgi:RNA polymerase sigma-70 factor (ECF subfamily)